jgi:hypothetical protein
MRSVSALGPTKMHANAYIYPYPRKDIVQAKAGWHWIRFQPEAKLTRVRVAKVRGYHAWVVLPDGQTVRLNDTCSRLLIYGEYRHHRHKTRIQAKPKPSPPAPSPRPVVKRVEVWVNSRCYRCRRFHPGSLCPFDSMC